MLPDAKRHAAVRCRSPADWGRQRSPQMDRSLSPPPARRPAYSPRAQEVRGNDGGRGEAREATFYVGGLSYSATADKVRSAFSRLGPIREFKLIIDRETSQSKGFGFLTFEVCVLCMCGAGATLWSRVHRS